MSKYEVSNDGERWYDLAQGRDARMFQFSRLKLKVGDVCKDWNQLRAGMVIEWKNSGNGAAYRSTLTGTAPLDWFDTGEMFWGCIENNGAFARAFIEKHGVTILSLPEEERPARYNGGIKCDMEVGPCACGATHLPAAPSLEVPVGSRWRWNDDSHDAFTVTAVFSGIFQYVYDTGTKAERPIGELLNEATRIDEPVKGEAKLARTVCKQCGLREVEEARLCYVTPTCYACLPPPEPLTIVPWPPTKQPAPPPARCAPDCTPASPCRVVLSWSTENGAAGSWKHYKCPVFAEENISVLTDGPDRVHEIRHAADQREAREWRSQPWEPMPSGYGGLMGRYRGTR